MVILHESFALFTSRVGPILIEFRAQSFDITESAYMYIDAMCMYAYKPQVYNSLLGSVSHSARFWL